MWVSGWMDERTNGLTDGRTDGRMDGWMDTGMVDCCKTSLSVFQVK